MGLGYPHPTGMEVPMGTEEPLTVVTARVTATESQWAKDLGSGNASAGIRRAIRAAHQLHETGTKAQPDARLSQLLEHALKLAHGLEAAAAADVISTPSGTGWMPKPTRDLILQFHDLMPEALLAMPGGVMAWGKGPGGDAASLVIDAQNGQIGLADAGNPENVMVPLEGLGDLAAIADTLAQAHHQARLASAKGKPITSAVAECPGLQLRIRPADAEGLAVVEVGGGAIRMHPLAYMQLLAEVHSLLARGIARSVEQRQGLEALMPQRPVVAGERSHGEG